MQALVLGGHGAVGRVVVDALLAAGHDVTPTGRRPGRTGLCLDVDTASGRRALWRAAKDVRVVVNASGSEDPSLLAWMGDAIFVEISASGHYLDELMSRTTAGPPVVLGAGLVPGLSTVLVAALDTVPGDDVDLFVMLGSGERHGTAAVEWTERLVGTEVYEPPEEHPVANLRPVRRFAGPDGVRRRHLRADFPDHILLGRRLGIGVRSHLSLSSRVATSALRLVSRWPRLVPTLRRAPHLGSESWHVVAVNHRTGEQRAVSGSGQSRATGIITALAAEVAVAQAISGTVTTADLLSLDAALAALSA